jgi:ribosome-associated translation inhibitor RaiA
MLFHFHTGDVTFFPEDQAYFETKFLHLEKLLGFDAGDSDSCEATINLLKNKHNSGDRFEANATILTPQHGKFHAEVQTENIKKCADELHDKLKIQVSKFHDKHK